MADSAVSKRRLAWPLLMMSDRAITPASTTIKLVKNGNPNIVTFLYCKIGVKGCKLQACIRADLASPFIRNGLFIVDMRSL